MKEQLPFYNICSKLIDPYCFLEIPNLVATQQTYVILSLFSLPFFFLPLSLDYLFLLTLLPHQSGSSREKWEKERRFIQILLCLTCESGYC